MSDDELDLLVEGGLDDLFDMNDFQAYLERTRADSIKAAAKQPCASGASEPCRPSAQSQLLWAFGSRQSGSGELHHHQIAEAMRVTCGRSNS